MNKDSDDGFIYCDDDMQTVSPQLFCGPVGICPFFCPTNGHVPEGWPSRSVRSIGMFVFRPYYCKSGFSGLELCCSGHALV